MARVRKPCAVAGGTGGLSTSSEGGFLKHWWTSHQCHPPPVSRPALRPDPPGPETDPGASLVGAPFSSIPIVLPGGWRGSRLRDPGFGHAGVRRWTPAIV